MFLTKSILVRGIPLLSVVAHLLLIACSPFVSGEISAPAATLITATPIAIDPQTHRLYAVDAARNRLIVTDPANPTPSYITAGRSPVALALDPSLARLYVVNSGSGTVSVVDTATNAITTELKTDTHPYTLALDTTLHRVFVANTFSKEVTVIGGTSNNINRLPLGSKDAIVVDVRHHRVYLSSYEDPNILVLDESTSTTTKLPAAIHTWALAVDADSGTLYAAIIGSNELLIFPGGTGQPLHVPTGTMPDAVATDAGAQRVYISNRESDTVTVVDAQAGHVLATVPVGQHPAGLAVDSAHHCIYVANTAAGTVSVIDGATNRVTSTLPAGHAPYALSLDPATRTLFAAGIGSPAVTRLPQDNRSGCTP